MGGKSCIFAPSASEGKKSDAVHKPKQMRRLSPMDSLGAVYDALMEAGKPHGIVNAGYRAIESLRLEKFYRAWSSDISPDHSPLEAGMAWAVKLKKNTPFLGREALVAQAAKKLPKLLA